LHTTTLHMPAPDPTHEEALRAACEAADYERCAALALRRYGPEILGFLVHTCGDDERGHEAFSQFTEDFWRGLPSFRWLSSLRTWCYVLARHAALRVLRDPAQRRQVPLLSGELDGIAAELRSATAPYLRTQVKDAITRLREALDPDERMLLTLRVDRGLGWRELAAVLSDEPVAERDLARQSATLRKRFERIKERLRAAAAREGLLDE